MPYTGYLSDGTFMNVHIRGQQLGVYATGTLETISEIGEIFAWLGAALRSSSEDGTIIYSTPYIESLDIVSRSADIASVTCRIEFNVQSETTERVSLPSKGSCWQMLFRNPVIVKGYPIRLRPAGETGIEIPLDMMAALIEAQRLTLFAGNIFIKSFSSMLVVTKQWWV